MLGRNQQLQKKLASDPTDPGGRDAQPAPDLSELVLFYKTLSGCPRGSELIGTLPDLSCSRDCENAVDPTGFHL